jgi:hypothetical protein
MSPRILILGLITLWIALPGAAATVDICFKNEASLTQATVSHLESSLRIHQKDLSVELRFACDSESTNQVVITLRDVPANNQLQDALGATRVRNGRILPQIEIFCDSVRRLVRTQRPVSPTLEGWALAKVAAHELYHYLRVELGHRHGGLNDEFLTAERLIQGFRESALATRRSD